MRLALSGLLETLEEMCIRDRSQDQYLTMLAFNGHTNPRMGYGMALLSAAAVFGISYLITYQILATTML